MLIHNSATKRRRKILKFLQPNGDLILDRANIRQNTIVEVIRLGADAV